MGRNKSKYIEVRVKVLHAAVNPIDWKLFSGGYHSMCPATFPYVPGFDLAGTVDAVGEGVSLAVGDTIIADTGLLETCVDPAPNGGSGGAFAEYAIVPEKLAAKIKAGDARTLAGLPLAGLTSYQALFTGGGAYTNAKFVNMILKSDGADLKAMVKLFDEGKLKVCVDEHFAFDEVKEALSKSLTARSGGKLVIDVASPAPSETCCVVA